ncbi:MAG: hypothetical protein GF398_19340 [Chitinivibrionales bacterium]|nr:hypothetical protein [Chitinivibrionales bacterium]
MQRIQDTPQKALERGIKRAFEKGMLTLSGRRKTRDRPNNILRIALLVQEKIGDQLLVTPLLVELKKALPHVAIDAFVFKKEATILANMRSVCRVVYARNLLATLIAYRRRPYDVLFNTKDHPSTTFILASLYLKAEYAVGISHPQHSGIYHACIQTDFYSHVIEKNCKLLDLLNIAYRKEQVRPHLPQLPMEQAAKQFKAFMLSLPTICLNISAGESSRELTDAQITAVIAQSKRQFIILAMPERFELKAKLEHAYDQVTPTPQTQSIFEAAALIDKCAFLITPDTALVHVAAALNKPLIGLYRSDKLHFSRFYPYRVTAEILHSPTNELCGISIDLLVDKINQFAKTITADPPG